MLKTKPLLIQNSNVESYKNKYSNINTMLLKLLETPIIETHHIGSTAINSALTSGVIDILVVVKSLHDMTTLDEKRLNLQKFYRLHHPYDKKCVYAHFKDLKSLEEDIRLHIIEAHHPKLNQYLQGQELNEQYTANFNTFKMNINNNVKRSVYESMKSEWFANNLKV